MDLRGCRAKYRALAPNLTERSCRVWAATEARALGRGGIVLVARATGIFHARFLAGGGELVQVCAEPSAENTMDRELRALSEAAREYPRAKRRLLVLTQDQVFPMRAPGVQVQPAYEWLLSTAV